MTSSFSEVSDEAKLQAQLNFQKGFNLLKMGNFDEADAFFIVAYKIDSKNIDALNLLGIRSYQKQDLQQALIWLNQANLLQADSPHTLNTLGLTYIALGEYQKALEHLDLAITHDFSIPEIHNNRGHALKGLKQHSRALEAFNQAIKLRPNYSEALNNMGVILLEDGQMETAIQCFKNAIHINQNFSEAFNNLGNALTEIGRYELSFDAFKQAIKINSQYIDAYINFGNSLKRAKQYTTAIQCYERALSMNHSNGKIYNLLGETYYDIGNLDLSKENFGKACELAPHNDALRIALAISQIPKVAKSAMELNDSRVNFANQLKILKDLSKDIHTDVELVSKLISRHPFHLAYQEENNKDLIAQFGLICIEQAKKIQSVINTQIFRANKSQKIQLGIISSYFCDHPVWHAITKGLVENLDSNLFEIHIFNAAGSEDQETVLAQQKSRSYLRHAGSNEGLINAIIQRNLDVLLYPEIGMNPTIKTLACLRLAPLQIASWGHPETTGLPTIDFFISGKAFEPNGYPENYSEHIMALPNLGTYFKWEHIVAANVDINALGLDQSAPFLICAGSPSKYSPENDYVFVEIAKRLGKCQFVLFNFQSELSSLLKTRLNQAFLDANLNPEDFIRFIPFLPKDSFYGLMLKSTLYLDTIGFSGFNTAMQAIDCELPIVTLEGKYMRGRFAAGILNSMNLGNLVCKSHQEYVDRTIQLIEEKEVLHAYKKSIADAKMGLIEDMEPIKAFESFLMSTIHKNPQEA